jgi:hypothetical protein
MKEKVKYSPPSNKKNPQEVCGIINAGRSQSLED